MYCGFVFFFFSSRRRHTRYWRDWSSDVCSSDLAGDRVRDEGPRQAVIFRQRRIFAAAFRGQVTVGELEIDAARKSLREPPLRALHFDRALEHLDGDSLGNDDRFLSNSRHVQRSLLALGVRLWA